MNQLFLEHYPSKTGVLEALFSFATNEKFFNYHMNFSFQKPRTDVCNLCFENKQTGIINPEVLKHKQKADDYLKKRLK